MTDDSNQNSSEEPQNGNNSASLSSTLGRFGTVAVGLVLLLFGMSMVIPNGTTGSSGMERALGALVTALGGGIIATVLLPHSLELDGQQVKPFGVDLKASGGAAVFVLSLLFAYFGAQVFGDTPSPEPTPADGPTATPTPDPTDAGSEGATDPQSDQTEQPATPVPTSTPTPSEADRPDGDLLEEEDFGQSYDAIQNARSADGLYRFMTYCPLQCPAGPEFCPSFAWGQHIQRIPAQEIAVSYCVGAGGDPACCANNLEAF